MSAEGKWLKLRSFFSCNAIRLLNRRRVDLSGPLENVPTVWLVYLGFQIVREILYKSITVSWQTKLTFSPGYGSERRAP